jgi:hypothetical protein
MGMEAECTVTHRKQKFMAKAHLETDHLMIRGGEHRLKILFTDLRKVAASGDDLELQFEGGPAKLALGEKAAAKWANKIMNPPTRMDKLGIKPGVRVFVEGTLDQQFDQECPRPLTKDPAAADLLFYGATVRADLDRACELAQTLAPQSALWVVYPKGKKDITEMDVLLTLRAAGVQDAKVCGFNATHTALKFIVPLAKRPKPLK